MERRLAAILAVDVVGYSRLMELDEAGTFSRLRAHRKELFEPEIAARHGRVFKLMGDGLLAEFASVVDAVECAVALQSGMAARNAAAASADRIDARIGINLGDVIVEKDESGSVDIHGEGVIIADRIQALAEPGGICVSQAVVDHVRNRIAIAFELVGEQRVKNIAEPVRIHRVLVNPAMRRRSASRPTLHRNRHWIAAAAVLVASIAGALAWQRPWQPRLEAASIEKMALPLPDKPSIAVLPFLNLSDDPKQEYFTDGLTDGLITELSRVSSLFVISRNSTFPYKGKNVPPRQVSEELGVRYVLEGSVQGAGGQLRVNAQLIDAVHAGHVWAGKFDGSAADVFALQDEVARSVAGALAVKLTSAEHLALAEREARVPAAYESFLQGWAHYSKGTPEGYIRAIPYLEDSIRQDPNYSRAQAAIAMIYFSAYDQGWPGMLGLTADNAFRTARDRLELASARPTSISHQVAGNIYRSRGWHDDAVKEFDAAIALDPNDSWSYAHLAYALIYAGRPAEAVTRIETAMRLDPQHSPTFEFYKGLAQFQQNRMAEAATTLEAAVVRDHGDLRPLLYLVAAYGHLDRREDAARAAAAYSSAQVRRGGVPLTVYEVAQAWDCGVPRPPEGSPLVTGLLKAGVSPDYRSDEFKSLILTPAEIEELFFGHRLHGRSLHCGLEHGVSVAADGTALMYGNWGVGTGVAQLAEDGLCFVWSSTTNCGQVLRNPGGTREKENEYIWVVLRGAFAFSQQD